ncbi:MAG: type II toxin-antitoxin system Phd/YefM family antitoxin [Rubrivivax sp.]
MTAQVKLHDAKTRLSRLVEQAARGQGFVIAKAGKPMVRAMPVDEPGTQRRLGFLSGQAVVSIDVKFAFEEEMLAQVELGGSVGEAALGSTKPHLRTPIKTKTK